MPEGSEPVDTAEFDSYAPIIGCAVVITYAAYVVLMLVLTNLLTIPTWLVRLFGITYVTLPQVALTRWVWNKRHSAYLRVTCLNVAMPAVSQPGYGC
jgi:hypothetical protein